MYKDIQCVHLCQLDDFLWLFLQKRPNIAHFFAIVRCLPQAVVAAETVAEFKRILSNVDLSSVVSKYQY